MRYDVAIIGAGPGGEAAAERAKMRGASVCLIEAGRLGGACLNVGCIPTKAMLHAGELFWQMQRAEGLGISAGQAKLDGPAYLKHAADVVATIVKALDRKYASPGVELIRGRGRLTGPNTIQVALNDGGREEVEAESIIIATGSSPVRPDAFDWSSPNVWTTDEAATAQELPASVLIVGGGVIGCEFATIYGELGIPTTLVEMLDGLVATLDDDAAKLIHRSLRRRKVDVLLASKIVKMTASRSGILARTDGGRDIEAAKALIAVGRRANVEDIGLDAAGVKVEGGIIGVDDRCRTNVPHIYAVGDVAETRQYAHLAARMGVVAAENATGRDVRDDRSAVPVAMFTHPEVAAIGPTEAEARRKHPDVRAASVQYQATGVGWAYDRRDGLVKIVAEDGSGLIRSGLVIGYHAADVVQELAAAVKHGLTVGQIAETIHTHPTFSEGVRLAAEKWLAGPD